MTVQYVVVADIALKDPLMASYVKQGHTANQDLQMKHLAHLDSSVERERLYPQNAGEEHFAKMEALKKLLIPFGMSRRLSLYRRG